MQLRVLSVLFLGIAACGPTAKPVTEPIPPPPDTDPVVADPAGGGGERTPTTSFEIEDNHLVLPGPIVFVTGAADLDVDASAAALWYLHDYLVAKPAVTLLRLEGHTDEAGDDALYLTGDRALAVGRWLVAHDVACDRLLAAAFGNLKPVADGRTAEGRARNRRIEAVNAQLRGIAIGGMPVDGSAPAAVPVCD